MSLNPTVSIAESAMSVHEQALKLSSQNIYRSKEEGYDRVTLQQSTNVMSGASIVSVLSEVDEYITAELNSQTSLSSYTANKSEYMKEIVNMFGPPNTVFDGIPDSSGYTISDSLGKFFASVNSSLSEPENSAQKQDLVLRAKDISARISSILQKLDSLGKKIDNKISIESDNVNNQVELLSHINSEIKSVREGTEVDANLLMARRESVRKIASFCDVMPYASDGTLELFMGSGIPLLDATKRTLEYYPDSDGDMLLKLELGDKNPISQTLFSEKDQDFKHVSSGSLKALLEVKNKILPNVRNKLAAFAESFSENVNSVLHGSTAYPGEKSLISAKPDFQQNGPMNLEGQVRLAVLNNNGECIKDMRNNPMKSLDLNMSDFKTTDMLTDEINSYFTTPGHRAEIPGEIANFSLYTKPGKDGVFSLGLDADGISAKDKVIDIDIVEVSYKDPQYGNAQTVFKSDTTKRENLKGNERKILELVPEIKRDLIPKDANDLLVEVNFRVDDRGYQLVYDLNSKTTQKISRTDAKSISGGGSKFSKENKINYLTAAITDKDSLREQLTGFFHLESRMKGVNVAMSRIGEATENDFPDRVAFHDFFLSDYDKEGRLQRVSVSQYFQDNPSRIPTAKITDSPVPSLGLGGNSLISELAALSDKPTKFQGADPKTDTYVNYLSGIIEHTASESIAAKSDDDREQYVQKIVESKRESVSGVNIEEEIQNILNIKYMYNACTHILSSVQEMYSFLMDTL